MINGCRKIRDGDGSVGWCSSILVAFPYDHAGLYASAPHGQAEATRPMIPARSTLVLIEFGRTTKFSCRDHQGGLQHAAIVKIFQKRRITRVVDGQLLIQVWKNAPMMIPCVNSRIHITLNRYESYSRLNKPPGQKHPLTNLITAIGVPEFRWFIRQVEGFFGLGRSSQPESLFCKNVVISGKLELMFLFGLKKIKGSQETFATAKPSQIDIIRSIESLDRETRCIGILGDEKRIISMAKVSTITRSTMSRVLHIAQVHEGRNRSQLVLLLA